MKTIIYSQDFESSPSLKYGTLVTQDGNTFVRSSLAAWRSYVEIDVQSVQLEKEKQYTVTFDYMVAPDGIYNYSSFKFNLLDSVGFIIASAPGPNPNDTWRAESSWQTMTFTFSLSNQVDSFRIQFATIARQQPAIFIDNILIETM